MRPTGRSSAPGRPARDRAPPVRRGQPHQRPDPRLRRADQAPRRRTSRRSPACPTRTVAEEDLLDTAWLQRCAGSASSRAPAGSSRPPSTRASPTASGVMHEAGLWARSLYPSLRDDAGGGRRDRAVRGPRRRDAADGRPAPRRRARAVRPLLRRPRAGRLRGAARRAPTGRQAADPRGPVAAGSSRTSSGRCCAACAGRPGAVAERDAFADGEAIDPALGRVPRLQAGPRRPGDAALGPLAPAAAVGRVHRRQPRLRPARRVPDRGRDRPGRRRAAASLRVHLGARADPVRAGPPGARDVPDLAPVHVPAGLLPPDRAGDRPRPRARSSGRRSGRSSATARRPIGWRPTPTSTSTRCSTRRPAGRAARRWRRGPRPATGR